jgi:hypothetical protein
MKRLVDPYLIKARFVGQCSNSHCKCPIKPGDEALYYPNSRKLVCRECATPTLEALADERMMG